MAGDTDFVNAANHILADANQMGHKKPVMELDQKLSLLETGLERAAEQLGDITEPVIQRYYAMHPKARASFAEHGLGNAVKLEAEMVESVVYCLMNWLERPQEIRIMFGSTVPHHEDILQIDNRWFGGLVDAAVDIITATIPAAATDEHRLWSEIHRGILTLIEDARL